jgi:hypothetical protein
LLLHARTGTLREIEPMHKLDNETLLLAFVAVTGLAVLLQAMILLAIYISLNKAARAVREEVEDLRSSMMPIIYNTREMFTRLAPKIEETVGEVAEIARGLRVQSAEVQLTTVEMMEKMRRQTSRVDAIVTGVLDGVDRAGVFLADAVGKPVHQAAKLLAAFKAIVEALRNSAPAPEHVQSHAPGDKDIFV